MKRSAAGCAADFYDGHGPLLTSVGLNLDAARSRLAAGNGDTLTLLARAKDASSQAIADLRTVVYSLRPPALDDLGVVGAITAHLHRMEQTGTIDIEVENHGLPALPAAVEVALFRIAQEAVTNVVRHSEANCVASASTADASADVEVWTTSDVAGTPESAWSRSGTGRPGWPARTNSAAPRTAAAYLTPSPCWNDGRRCVGRRHDDRGRVIRCVIVRRHRPVPPRAGPGS